MVSLSLLLLTLSFYTTCHISYPADSSISSSLVIASQKQPHYSSVSISLSVDGRRQ